jgi:hypothetical protein
LSASFGYIANRGPQFFAIEQQRGIQRFLEHLRHARRIAAYGFFQQQRECAASQVAHVLRVRPGFSDAHCNLLEKPIAGMAAERIVDQAKFLHIKHRDAARLPIGRGPEALRQALTKQLSLRKTGERVEIGQIMNGLVLLQILQREAQIRTQLQQNLRFRFIEHLGLAAEDHQRTDGSSIDEQGQRTEGAALQQSTALGFVGDIVERARHAAIDGAEHDMMLADPRPDRIGCALLAALAGHGARLEASGTRIRKVQGRIIVAALIDGNTAHLAE